MAGEVERLQELVDKYDNIVFFGGAGVSTESGIPDFRSQDGLYHQKYDYPPETILSHTFFMRKPEEFFKFYRDKMLCDTAKPNAAHLKLAELEQAGKLKAVSVQKKSQSGAVTELTVMTEGGTGTVDGEYSIREFLSPRGCKITEKDGSVTEGGKLLPSAYFEIQSQDADGITLKGGGYGHGRRNESDCRE